MIKYPMNKLIDVILDAETASPNPLKRLETAAIAIGLIGALGRREFNWDSRPLSIAGSPRRTSRTSGRNAT